MRRPSERPLIALLQVPKPAPFGFVRLRKIGFDVLAQGPQHAAHQRLMRVFSAGIGGAVAAGVAGSGGQWGVFGENGLPEGGAVLTRIVVGGAEGL